MNFLHFAKRAHTIKPKETTLLVDFFSLIQFYVLTGVPMLTALRLQNDEHDADT
jgi:hypothetical protein